MIHIIINPKAGQDKAVLATLNAVFRPADVKWTVSVTQHEGDASTQARQAVVDGANIVVAYGGDGTVVEAASGLIGSDVPLAILPGGTANVVAQEMGIPLELEAACQLIVNRHTTRTIDMGTVNDKHFLLRVGIGAEAKITEGADRSLKDKIGFLAYAWSATQSLVDVEQATYSLTIDGEEIEVKGVTCGIINSGNMGLGDFQIAPDIRMDDGLLDVVVLQNADLPALTEVLGSVLGLSKESKISTADSEESCASKQFDGALQHWTGKEVDVRVQPPQSVQYDGEVLEAENVQCRVLPDAVRICVPE